jgi:outer membrane protein OmpA-like peptidoglycan-associated protein
MSTVPNDIRFLNGVSLKQYYANSRNNIEDPIFTGFTVEIDEEHSPLFFGGREYYDYTTSLRSPDGTDTGLANAIESRLKKMYSDSVIGSPDTYEINTLFAKDPFSSSNERKIGYGLQDKFYLDNVLYGATDYIYMVDKISDDTFSDNFGVADIGNGTPNTSLYGRYADELNDIDQDTAAQTAQDDLDNATSENQKINIFFNLDKYDIRDDQKASIETLIQIVNSNPGCTINLSGYADKETGTSDHNQWLSEQRCNIVEENLLDAGVDPSKITKTPYGDKVQPFVGELNRATICEVVGDVSQEAKLDLKIMQVGNTLTSMIDKDGKEQNEILNEHNKNEEDATKAKTAYENAMKDGSNNSDNDYDKVVEKLKNIEDSIQPQKLEARDEYSNFLNTMNSKLEMLNVVTDEDNKQMIYNDIEKIYNQFNSFFKYFKNEDKNGVNDIGKKYSEVYSYVSAATLSINENEVNKELEKLKDKLSSVEQEHYKKIYTVLKSSFITQTNDFAKSEMDRLKTLKNKYEEKLYGIFEGGMRGSEDNPAPGSLYEKYMNAKNKSENDAYSINKQKIDELKDIKDKYPEIKSYQEHQSQKNQVVRNPNLPSSDYETRQNATRNTYEVPQTVYDMLGFVHGMEDLIYNYPYMLQTITGLDEAYKKYFEVKDPYQGSGDGKITINCLEFLDMRISSMFNKYFNAAYDRQYRRERVPINLRRFECSIFVHDIRNFKDTIDGNDLGSTEDLSLITKIALNYMSAIEFKFYDCEIVPEETGGIFDNVTNLPNNEMRSTNFTFKYGNCVINFLPFEDLRRYLLKKDTKDLVPKDPKDKWKHENFEYLTDKINSKYNYAANSSERMLTGFSYDGRYSPDNPSGAGPDGNFRRWFDKSELGNVNNNDYRDYVRHDSAVAVDDHYKTTIVNDFALNSVGQKNKELTEMDDALRRMVVGISASTGIPIKGVTDALNIKFIDPIINEKDYDKTPVKEIGNVNNSRVVNADTMEYIGEVEGDESTPQKIITDLGNINDTEKGGE